MAKVTLSRLFEVSKYLVTDAGKELKDALVYLSEFVEVTTRNLRNGLTFGDNFDTKLKSVSVLSDVETVVLADERRRVKEVIIRQAIDDTYYIISEFGWKYNSEGNVVITAVLRGEVTDENPTGSPAVNQTINLAVMFHFG